MEIRDQRSDVPRGIRPIPLFLLAIFYIILYPLWKMHIIPLVYGIDLSVFRKLHIVMGKVKSTQCGIKGKTIYPVPRGIYQHGRGAVYDITRRDLVPSRL